MTICNLVPSRNRPTHPVVWDNRRSWVWDGKAGGRKVTVSFERNVALKITEVVVKAEFLPGLPMREAFRSRVEGWLKPPYTLNDARKALRHFAVLTE